MPLLNAHFKPSRIKMSAQCHWIIKFSVLFSNCCDILWLRMRYCSSASLSLSLTCYPAIASVSLEHANIKLFYWPFDELGKTVSRFVRETSWFLKSTDIQIKLNHYKYITFCVQRAHVYVLWPRKYNFHLPVSFVVQNLPQVLTLWYWESVRLSYSNN
jgi:hypothetical protein